MTERTRTCAVCGWPVVLDRGLYVHAASGDYWSTRSGTHHVKLAEGDGQASLFDALGTGAAHVHRFGEHGTCPCGATP